MMAQRAGEPNLYTETSPWRYTNAYASSWIKLPTMLCQPDFSPVCDGMQSAVGKPGELNTLVEISSFPHAQNGTIQAESGFCVLTFSGIYM